jgi:hypothetical protein
LILLLCGFIFLPHFKEAEKYAVRVELKIVEESYRKKAGCYAL